MTAIKTGKWMLSLRILGAALAAMFAVLAAGCAPDSGYGNGPAPTAPSPKSAPAPDVAVVAPAQANG
jgi:hypothetical protein